MKPCDSNISEILHAVGEGDPKAPNALLDAVYSELRQLAANKMSREKPGHTLQPTALVHEAWLRLGGVSQQWKNRSHFFGAAAEAMRRILIESARKKRALRRGGDLERVDIHEIQEVAGADTSDLLTLNAALEKFALVDPLRAELVKLRYFVGLTNEEAAEILGISERTAKRHWKFARAWLYNAMRDQ